MQTMTKEVKAAFEHVREHCPYVNMVVFDSCARWLWLNDDKTPAEFTDEIDVSILEDAADSLDCLPCVFEYSVD